MDKDFQEFFVENFKPTLEREADISVIRKYEGLLPENLLGIWRFQGWSGYFNGLFWIVNPDEYHGVLMDFQLKLAYLKMKFTAEKFIPAQNSKITRFTVPDKYQDVTRKQMTYIIRRLME